MTVGEWQRNYTKTTNDQTAYLDAAVILSHVLSTDRTWLTTNLDTQLSTKQLVTLFELCERRKNGEPIAYIVGRKEFYGRDFIVNKDTLVPRPESESFITLLKELHEKHNAEIKEREAALAEGKTSEYYNRQAGFMHNLLDIGTGSGCLAITAKLEFPDMYVTATDTSTKALKVAIQNARTHNTPIVFKKQSLLTNDKEGYDIVMANLPYVPLAMQDKSIMLEPAQALFSGSDGLNHYRRLFRQLKTKHIRYVMTESLLSQHAAVENLAKRADYSLNKTEGLVQLFTKFSS